MFSLRYHVQKVVYGTFCMFCHELIYLDPLEEQDEVFKYIQQQIEPLMKGHQAHLFMKPASQTHTESAVINSAVMFILRGGELT